MAIHLLLKVIGVRLELDRITIAQTDIKDREIYSDYQWNREGIPKVLETVRHFDKEDFLTVFNDFDENGVLRVKRGLDLDFPLSVCWYSCLKARLM